MNKMEYNFWRKVDKSHPDKCWPWTASTNYIYGCFNRGLAHRYSYELHNGPIPEKMFVCHTCDNPICVNPAHLFLGTAKDNSQDSKDKGNTGHMGIRPAKVIRAIRLYKDGFSFEFIHNATKIPMHYLKDIMDRYDLEYYDGEDILIRKPKHDLAFGDDSWEQLFARQLTRALQGLEKAMEAEE